jgi:hypothetical protein
VPELNHRLFLHLQLIGIANGNKQLKTYTDFSFEVNDLIFEKHNNGKTTVRNDNDQGTQEEIA